MMDFKYEFRFLMGLGQISELLKLEFIFFILFANFQNLGSILGRKKKLVDDFGWNFY